MSIVEKKVGVKVHLDDGFVMRGGKHNWRVLEELGKGGFGVVYRVQRADQGDELVKDDRSTMRAMKIELNNKVLHPRPTLAMDVEVLNHVGGREGYVSMVEAFTGASDSRGNPVNCLVMGLAGLSLQNLSVHGELTPKCVVNCTDHILSAIQILHEAGYLHRDMKPENWAIGVPPEHRKFYVLDLGMCRRFKNRDGSMRSERTIAPGRGTPVFASRASHDQLEQVPMDDIEAWFYSLVDLYARKLPWSYASRREMIKFKKAAFKKGSSTRQELLSTIPAEWEEIMDLINTRPTDQSIDYTRIHQILKNTMEQYPNQHKYDWEIKTPLSTIVRLFLFPFWRKATDNYLKYESSDGCVSVSCPTDTGTDTSSEGGDEGGREKVHKKVKSTAERKSENLEEKGSDEVQKEKDEKMHDAGDAKKKKRNDEKLVNRSVCGKQRSRSHKKREKKGTSDKEGHSGKKETDEKSDNDVEHKKREGEKKRVGRKETDEESDNDGDHKKREDEREGEKKHIGRNETGEESDNDDEHKKREGEKKRVDGEAGERREKRKRKKRKKEKEKKNVDEEGVKGGEKTKGADKIKGDGKNLEKTVVKNGKKLEKTVVKDGKELEKTAVKDGKKLEKNVVKDGNKLEKTVVKDGNKLEKTVVKDGNKLEKAEKENECNDGKKIKGVEGRKPGKSGMHVMSETEAQGAHKVRESTHIPGPATNGVKRSSEVKVDSFPESEQELNDSPSCPSDVKMIVGSTQGALKSTMINEVTV